MIIAEVRSKYAIVRIHDESCQKETRLAMAEVNRIVSKAYQRRISAAALVPLGNASIKAADH